MTTQKHLKRRIRERMRTTGESYTTARLRVIAARSALDDAAPPSPMPLAPPTRDVRIRAGSSWHLRRPRRASYGRHLAPAFTLLLSLLVGMAGLILVERPAASPPHPATLSPDSATAGVERGP